MAEFVQWKLSRKQLAKYGLSVSDWWFLFDEQDGLCGICQVKKRLVVDHDHVTGQVRGLLCNSCNTGLGHFGDDEKTLQDAIEYLKKPKHFQGR